MKVLINKILHKYGWYRMEELVIGGNCGLCGSWIDDEIFPVWWRWGVCKKCKEESEE